MSAALFRAEDFADEAGGPLYLQLTRRIAAAIDAGALRPGESLPPERELASLTGLSRVTVRKAVQTLVAGRAAGAAAGLGHLRGAAGREGRAGAVAAHLLLRGHGAAGQGGALGLAEPGGAGAVAGGDDGAGARPRTTAWRGWSGCGLADEVPLAIERASLSTAILPDPTAVEASLYAVLAERGLRPVRAVQRISAANLGARGRRAARGAGRARRRSRIERISYLPSGRVVEFTRSLYRGDAYDFAAELQIPAEQEGRT